MRRWLIALLALLLTALLCIANERICTRLTDRLTETVQQARQLAEQGDPAAALSEIGQLRRQLDDALFYLSVSTSHTEVDALFSSAIRCRSCLDQGDRIQFLIECDQLLELLEGLAESERMNWENIL
ncbi:MAG: DUF4363 family protein [Clostridia bacterium]|nr:DUF4363 family protein [Clostridia bacterium]